MTYPVANALAWVGIFTQITGLRYALRKSTKVMTVTLLVIMWTVVFEYFRVVLESSQWRFAWALALYVLSFFYIAYLGWQISITHQLRTGRWLSLAYVLAAAALFARTCFALLGWTHPDVVASGVDSVLTVISGLLISVIGSFAFVGMFIERAAKREIEEVQRRVRHEESLRLGEQVAQLERQRTLGAMSYSFAHEFSQPLTAILMDTQAIKHSLSASPVNINHAMESVQDVERSATRTVQLVERIRSFVKPSESAYEEVDMKLLVHDVQHLLTHEIRRQNVEFEWNLDDEPCLIHGDKIQISQILLNVYRNAIQAMLGHDVQKIWVTLSRENQRVVLRVHDSGSGLDESIKEKIGQPFMTTKSDGLGLGLSISKTIADMHNGNLSVTNAVGGGALVELNLPAAVAL